MSKAKRFSLAILTMLVLLVLTSCGGPEYTYKQAQELLLKGEYSAAAEKFASIPEYENAPVMTKYSQACALCEAGEYNKGIAALEALGDFEGCAERIEYYSALAGPEFNYKKAQTLLSQGKYAEAAAKFENLGSYEDAATLTKYCNACVLCEAGDYEKGIAALEALGDFEGCAKRIEYYSTLAGPEFNYKKAQALLSQGKYAEAAKKFESLGSYEEATTLTMYCKACALCESGNFEAGITALEKLGAYKDCAYRITYYTARSWDDNSVGTTEYEWMERAKSIYNENPLYLDSAERIAALEERIATAKKTLYDNAVTDAENGQYDAARTTFSRLGNYSDCSQRITYYAIRKAEDALGETMDQDAVVAVAKQYVDMGEYLDCEERVAALTVKANDIVATKYAGVQNLIDESKYAAAESALAAFGNYGNEQVTANYYTVAEKYLAEGQWDAASAAFKKAGDFSDAADRVLEPYYTQGEVLMADSKWVEAATAFVKAGSYNGAALRATYCGIRVSEESLAGTTNQDKVIAVAKRYTTMGEYLDCVDRAKALTTRADEIVAARYAEVEKLIAEGKCAEAEKILAAFGTYGNEQVQAKYYASAQKHFADSKWDEAIAAFKKAGSYSDAAQGATYCGIRKAEDALSGTTDQDKVLAVAKRYTAMGEYLDCADRAAALTNRADEIVTARYAEVDKLITEGKCAEAEKILAAFGTYGNAQVQEKYYAAAEKYLADGKWDEASAAFKKLENYSDAAERILEPYYRQGDALIADGQWSEAIAVFGKIKDYSDAATRIKYCFIREDEEAISDSTEQDSLIAMAKRYTDLGEYLDCADRAKALNSRANDICDSKYDAAKVLMDAGKYKEAYKAFQALKGYKDSAAQADKAYKKYKLEELKKVKVGSYVTFGTYEQDNNANNGKEDIEWLVLVKKNNRLLVISRYSLDCKSYNSTDEKGVTWATCTLRTWLNNSFLNAAFCEAEKTMISTVTVSADKNPNSKTSSGVDTKDKIFVLSLKEVDKYFLNDSERQCKPTSYAKVRSSNDEVAAWWLRTPGSAVYTKSANAVVYGNGHVDDRGWNVIGGVSGPNNIDFGVRTLVRPAMWINLD